MNHENKQKQKQKKKKQRREREKDDEKGPGVARNPLNRRRSKRRCRHTDIQKNTETWRGADKKKKC